MRLRLLWPLAAMTVLAGCVVDPYPYSNSAYVGGYNGSYPYAESYPYAGGVYFGSPYWGGGYEAGFHGRRGGRRR